MTPKTPARTTIALTTLAIVLAGTAAAGSPEAPELTDPADDCAVPYGNASMDVTAAWVDNETERTIDVHLQLNTWDPVLADGSGYAVQFTHQGATTGVIAVYIQAEGGWLFFTGTATRDTVEGMRETAGSFTPGATPVITVTFPKALLPHEDPLDPVLTDFRALAADLRPALPFILADDLGTDPSGKWILCDEAEGTGNYAFTLGKHAAPGGTTPASDSQPMAETDAVEPSSTDVDAAEGPVAETPAAGIGLVSLALLAAAPRRRNRT